MAIQYSDNVLKAMDEAEKRVLRSLALIGAISLNWNSVEETLERLLWHYLGSNEVGHIVTSRMHNASRSDVLSNLVDAREPISDIAVRIKHFLTAFDILRINRNAIVHSVQYTLDHSENTVWLERVKKSIRTREYDTYSMPVDTLEKLTDQMADLCAFGDTLLTIMNRRGSLMKQSFFDWGQPPPWPEIFPLPERLSSLPG